MRNPDGMIVAIARLLLAQSVCADESFSVILADKVVGRLTATTGDGETAILYDSKNNGRGSTMAEAIKRDAKGLPTPRSVIAMSGACAVAGWFPRSRQYNRFADAIGSLYRSGGSAPC